MSFLRAHLIFSVGGVEHGLAQVVGDENTD